MTRRACFCLFTSGPALRVPGAAPDPAPEGLLESPVSSEPSFLQGKRLSVCGNIKQLRTESPGIDPKFLPIVFPGPSPQKDGVHHVRGGVSRCKIQ